MIDENTFCTGRRSELVYFWRRESDPETESGGLKAP